jgi:hypothetical protein
VTPVGLFLLYINKAVDSGRGRGLYLYFMRSLLYIALTGLALSIVVQILSLVGFKKFLNDWKEFVLFLHGGVIFLGVPVILFGQRMTIGKDRKDFWKAALANCPDWMKKLIGIGVIYGFVSAAIGWFFITTNKSEVPFHFFSNGWIIGYALEFGVIYSYFHRQENQIGMGRE